MFRVSRKTKNPYFSPTLMFSGFGLGVSSRPVASQPGTNRPWNEMRSSPGQIGCSLFNYAVNSPFCPISLWDRRGSSLGELFFFLPKIPLHPVNVCFGDRKKFSISKNHPKPSQALSERFEPSIHKMKGSSRNSPQKLTRTSPKTWTDKFLGILYLVTNS